MERRSNCRDRPRGPLHLLENLAVCELMGKMNDGMKWTRVLQPSTTSPRKVITNKCLKIEHHSYVVDRPGVVCTLADTYIGSSTSPTSSFPFVPSSVTYRDTAHAAGTGGGKADLSVPKKASKHGNEGEGPTAPSRRTLRTMVPITW